METYFNGTVLIFSPKVSSLGTTSQGGAPAWHRCQHGADSMSRQLECLF